MAGATPISEAEWQVMEILWASSRALTAQEVFTALPDSTTWKTRTLKTLLSRLVKKGVVGFEPVARHYLYRPLVDQTTCVRAEARSFLDRVFGGAVTPMVAHMVQSGDIDKEEIDALQRLLDRARKASEDER